MKVVLADVLDVGVQREQPVLAVDRAKDPLALRHLQPADDRARLDRLESELLVAGDDDGARNGRQVARLPALLVILHEFVDLSPDDLALVGLLARGDPALEQVPVHLRRRLSSCRREREAARTRRSSAPRSERACRCPRQSATPGRTAHQTAAFGWQPRLSCEVLSGLVSTGARKRRIVSTCGPVAQPVFSVFVRKSRQ